ncbi:ubiquitin carboxyl-terminal hydrolase 42-like [Neopelma chrysocephalum]|uniref:ubiquitin carboxyl-terminal hydrolase 42-like n=1 Tax=Neopelma chrysocephalum TaxID=114329 RepID=UPI000FCCF174|nr:ubiquitin carboxyl-terminal hydrolase 42-like [Neopelma chrysocephalum]
MATAGNDSFIAEGMTPPQRILFPPEKICMVWQQRQSAGAGLRNVGNTCFLNAVLQCLTYTPPLANYLLSREHSRACRQQGFCMMCVMEAHVNKVLHSSVGAILPLAVLRGFRFIGEHFQLGREEDAHDFFCCTLNAMQRACLSASNDLDVSSQSTTIVHQIFGGFLRSRVICSSCKAVSDSYEAFLDVPLHIKVRGFAVVLQDIARLFRVNTFVPKAYTVNTRGLGRGWQGEWMLSSCRGHGTRLSGGAGFKLDKHPLCSLEVSIAPENLWDRGNVQHHTLFLAPSGYSLHIRGGSPQHQLQGFSYQLLENVWARALPAAQCTHFSILQAASSLTAALEDFVTPEHLDGENCFKCSKCEKNVAATKRFTVHCAPKVLTVCLKRFDCFTGGKINKVVEYPEYLDLRPYMSQADGEPLLYSLYAVLVHSGVSCHGGHYFCYTKASNGLWYRMDDESVELHSIDAVLRQQAYLLFYARCSELRTGKRAASSLTPSHAPAFLSQCVASSKQAASVGPQALTGRTKGMKYSGRERSRSRSPLWGRDLRSWSVETTDYDDSWERRTGPQGRDRGPRASAAARPSRRICHQFVQSTDYRPSEKKRRISMPQRFTSDKHSGHSGNDGVGLRPWLKQNGRLALR